MQTENTTLSIAGPVIGLIGVIVGALLKIFSDEVRTFLMGRSKGSKDFMGQWNCTWTYDHNSSKNTLVDKVDITKASGDKIFATGSTSKGIYNMTGVINNHDLILFSYSGEQLLETLGGVVILVANKRRKKMHGYWHEYVDTGEFKGGETVWEKIV